jgi:hypothetical protein
MSRHCPVTGELLKDCACGACDDIDYDATGGTWDESDDCAD